MISKSRRLEKRRQNPNSLLAKDFKLIFYDKLYIFSSFQWTRNLHGLQPLNPKCTSFSPDGLDNEPQPPFKMFRCDKLSLIMRYFLWHYHIKDTQNHRDISEEHHRRSSEIYERLKPPKIYFALQSAWYSSRQSNSTLCSVLIVKHLFQQRHKFTVTHQDTLLQLPWETQDVTLVSQDEETNQDWKKKWQCPKFMV